MAFPWRSTSTSTSMTLLAILSTIVNINISHAWEDDYFAHSTYLDDNDDYRLLWNVVSGTEIEIGLEVNSVGWIGFGVSPGGGMAGADIVMAWIEADDQTVVLENRFAVGRVLPEMMEEQTNMELVSGSRVDGTTYVHFKRLIYPCDEHSVDIVTGTARVIYAWRNDVPIDNYPLLHSVRGSKNVNLLNGESKAVELPAEWYDFDVTVSELEVPAEDTTYYCKLVALPALSQVHHIIRADPVITPGNEALVHHILLFTCPEAFFNASTDVGAEGICNDWANMGFSPAQCLSGEILLAWAIGGGNLYLPEHVGFELGGSDPDALTHVVMQTHYDNPAQDAGIVDSSGLKLYYTPILRANSASLLSIGTEVSRQGIFVPAFAADVDINGYCVPECTNYLPQTGVHVFGNTLHSHYLGRKMKLRQIRDGVELAFIDVNDAYDFNYQQSNMFNDEIHILPGDELIVDCNYDASERDFVTFGGESTSEEMCMAFIMVYPKIEMAFCDTLFTEEFIIDWWTRAVENGYSSNTLPVNISGMNSFEYDVSVPGADAFYKQVWTQSERGYSCYRGVSNGWDNGVTSVPIAGQDFAEYAVPDLRDCESDPAKKSSSTKFWGESYFWIIIGACVLFAVLGFFFVQHRRQKMIDDAYVTVDDTQMVAHQRQQQQQTGGYQ